MGHNKPFHRLPISAKDLVGLKRKGTEGRADSMINIFKEWDPRFEVKINTRLSTPSEEQKAENGKT